MRARTSNDDKGELMTGTKAPWWQVSPWAAAAFTVYVAAIVASGSAS